MRISTFLIILGVGVVLGVFGANLPRLVAGISDVTQAVTRSVAGVQASPTPVVQQPVQAAAPVQTQEAPPRGNSQQLTRIVAAATQGPLRRTDALTEEQQQIVAFFERTAREMNEAGGQRLNRVLEFDHLAINGLDVRYYYTVRKNYADLNPAVVLAEQRAYISQTVCNDPAVRQLIASYGFRYSYSYLSQENRLIGRLNANLDGCAG